MEVKYDPSSQNLDPIESLKLRMEGWRELVIVADDVLGWEKDWYPAITAGSLTVLYLGVWWLEPSLLTLVSLVCLLVTLADFLVPRLADKLLPPHGWTEAKQNKLNTVAANIVSTYNFLASLRSQFSSLRNSSPLTHFSLVTLSLTATAYLGAFFSGVLLSYLCLLVVLMLPGLQRKGLLEQYCAILVSRVKDLTIRKKLE